MGENRYNTVDWAIDNSDIELSVAKQLQKQQSAKTRILTIDPVQQAWINKQANKTGMLEKVFLGVVVSTLVFGSILVYVIKVINNY